MLTNAEAKRLSMQKKRQNAYDNRRSEPIVATDINYDTYAYNNITIVMEDDGYAYGYVKTLLQKTYNFLNIELIGAHGEGCVHHLISYVNSDLLIVIYDKSNIIKLINNINTEIKAFKNRNPQAKVIKITPKAFEEIILSYMDMPKLIKTNDKQGIALLGIIRDYVTGKVQEYSLTNYVIKPNRTNADMILQDWMERLTVNTDYFCTHVPSVISDCWLEDCTSCVNKKDTCSVVTPVEIGNYMPKSKIEYIALNSLAYFITKAIDDYIGHKFRKTNCNLLDEKTIMTEV